MKEGGAERREEGRRGGKKREEGRGEEGNGQEGMMGGRKGVMVVKCNRQLGEASSSIYHWFVLLQCFLALIRDTVGSSSLAPEGLYKGGLSSALPIPTGIWSFWWNSGGFRNLHRNGPRIGRNGIPVELFICLLCICDE